MHSKLYVYDWSSRVLLVNDISFFEYFIIHCFYIVYKFRSKSVKCFRLAKIEIIFQLFQKSIPYMYEEKIKKIYSFIY